MKQDILKILGIVLLFYIPLWFGILSFMNWMAESVVPYGRLFLLSILLGVLSEFTYDSKKRKQKYVENLEKSLSTLQKNKGT